MDKKHGEAARREERRAIKKRQLSCTTRSKAKEAASRAAVSLRLSPFWDFIDFIIIFGVSFLPFALSLGANFLAGLALGGGGRDAVAQRARARVLEVRQKMAKGG